MAHSLFNDRFYSLRQPAWHGLGHISEVEMGAVDAFSRVTPFTVSLEKLYTEVDGRKFEIANQAIMRHPTPDAAEFKMLGVVGPDYTLVDPLRLCEIYDENVRTAVETLGALGSGETFFFTTRLPSFSVLGDDVDNYLLIVSPYGGNASIQVRLTPVRVVCQNTLMIAKRESTENYRIVHDKNAERKLGLWMAGITARFEDKTDVANEVFEAMAKTIVKDEDVQPLLELIYEDPRPFAPSVIPEENIRRQGWFEENETKIRRRRQAVTEVFQGKGVGQDTLAAKGTAWGAYNAVAEYEMYKPSTKANAAASDMLTGERADFTERAFTVFSNYARK